MQQPGDAHDARLATLTPAAGFVSPVSAAVIGLVAGVVCFYAVALKNMLKWDDALDVWGVHGVGGFIGIIMLGIFATRAYNPAGPDGLLAGNPAFLFKQCVAVLLSSVWAFVFAFGIAVAHRQDHASEGGAWRRGSRTRRGAPRRDGLRRSAVGLTVPNT